MEQHFIYTSPENKKRPLNNLTVALAHGAGGPVIAELLDACREYTELKRQRVFIAYTLIGGVNDQPGHARRDAVPECHRPRAREADARRDDRVRLQGPAPRSPDRARAASDAGA